jgi:hypothetical protein
MITNFLIGILTGLITSLSGIITTIGTCTTDVAGILGDVVTGVLGMVTFVAPICDPQILTGCVSIIFLLLIGDLLFRIGNWIFNKIPEIAGFGWGG